MKTWLVTLTHIDIDLLTASLQQVYKTVVRSEFHEHILVDHHWPIYPWIHRRELLGLAERFGCKVIAPYQNLGGAGGINWAIANTPMADEDIFIGIDSDSFPVRPGWVTAMRDVLMTPKYAAVSLKLNIELNTKVWDMEIVNGHDVVTPCANGIDMINVTGWKVGVFRAIGGFEGLPFYGGIEIPYFLKMRVLGYRHGYLRDFSEDMKPFEPHPEYRAWKAAHVSGEFPRNFCDWAASRGLG